MIAHLTRWRIGWRWWVAAVGPVALFGFASVIARLVEGTWPDPRRLGEVNFLSDIGAPAVLVLWIVTFGFGEETGWRGFALPHLQRRHSTMTATLLVAVMWAAWHAPYWLYSRAICRWALQECRVSSLDCCSVRFVDVAL